MSGVQHSSESNEHYTPREVVDAARETMGWIHLDPASCELANAKVVGAERFHSLEDPGHNKPWCGNVFLNPPGGIVDENFRVIIRASKAKGIQSCTVTGACGLPPGHKHEGATGSARRWWRKLADEYRAGRTEQAIYVGFSLEILQSAQSDGILDFPFCIPATRLDFLCPNDAGDDVEEQGQPTHANAIVYLPPRVGTLVACRRFARAFASIGRVVIPMVERTVRAAEAAE